MAASTAGDNPPLSYRGRFAPSPTGPLHFGSLLTAVASFLQARSRDGKWLVRMEDVDLPRNVPGADSSILHALEFYGLYWDGAVLYQSQRHQAYQAALSRLLTQGSAFHCGCTRREAASGPPGIEGRIYPGRCRSGLPPGRYPRSVRLSVDDAVVAFTDAVLGTCRQNLADDVGDFVIRRADGLFAYQLAVVIDDAWQGITEVVRGSDLLGSTARQIYLQQQLGVATPAYAHIPVARDAAGHKLSKQTRARPVPLTRPQPWLLRALHYLGQNPDPSLQDASRDDILAWAVNHWDLAAVPTRPVVISDTERECWK